MDGGHGDTTLFHLPAWIETTVMAAREGR